MSESKSRFKPGDRVFIELYPKTSPHLFSSESGTNQRPTTVMVRGVVQTHDKWSHGYSDQSRGIGPQVTKYITSYNAEMFDEAQLFVSVAEFEERRGSAIREYQERRRREAEEERLKAYRAAKRLVADFESEMFSAQASNQSATERME